MTVLDIHGIATSLSAGRMTASRMQKPPMRFMRARTPWQLLIAEYDGVEVIHPQSGLIECVAYNALRRRMRVTFTSGRRVDFTETPDTVFRAFARSQAPDDFFEKRIRGQFAWCEVGGATEHE